MNGDARKIEVLAPFNQAIELTKRILFQPFDLEKWLVIGFAAFLSHLGGGGGGGGGNFGNWGSKKWNYAKHTSHVFSTTDGGTPLWLIPAIIAGGIVIMAVVIVLLWIGCRGRFIFLDCIVRNRGAIKEPWREYRREGNGFFGFSLLVMVIFVVAIGLSGLTLWISLVAAHGDFEFGGLAAIGIILVFMTVFVLALTWSLLAPLMVVAMYRRRIGAFEAFQSAVALIMSNPVPFILYVLLLFVLGIVVGIIACVSACVTCCITALPYVGTVVLLPLYVALSGYSLLFIRQFGPEWDAWDGGIALPQVSVTAAAATPVEPAPQPPPAVTPPVQTPESDFAPPPPPTNEPPPSGT